MTTPIPTNRSKGLESVAGEQAPPPSQAPSQPDPQAKSLPFLPPEVRWKIWTDALTDPNRVVLLSISLICGYLTSSGDWNTLGSTCHLPINGIFFVSHNQYRADKNSLQAVWPTEALDMVKALSMVSRETRAAVMERYPDLIPVTTYKLPIHKEYTLRCNLKEDIFLMDVHEHMRIPIRREIEYATILHPFVHDVLYGHGAPERWHAPYDAAEHEAKAARADAFRETLRSMEKLAFPTTTWTEPLLAPYQHESLACPAVPSARMGGFEYMMRWLPNKKIIYYLPPHVALGHEFRAVPLQLDDVWRPCSGRSRVWRNPHAYIRLTKNTYRHCGKHSSHVTTTMLNASAVDAVRHLEPEVAPLVGLWIPPDDRRRLRDIMLTRMGNFSPMNNTPFEFEMSSKWLAHGKLRDAAKRGELPTTGLLLPGPSFQGVDVDMQLVAQGRSERTFNRYGEDWSGLFAEGNTWEKSFQFDDDADDQVGRTTGATIALDQYMRFHATMPAVTYYGASVYGRAPPGINLADIFGSLNKV